MTRDEILAISPPARQDVFLVKIIRDRMIEAVDQDIEPLDASAAHALMPQMAASFWSDPDAEGLRFYAALGPDQLWRDLLLLVGASLVPTDKIPAPPQCVILRPQQMRLEIRLVK